MTKITAGGAALVRLKALGVDRIFANSGTDYPPVAEGAAQATAAGLPIPDIHLIAHEHAAMGMAHGAWAATGGVQAVMLHTNVGLANGAIGALNAASDQVPVIILSGRTPVVEAGRPGARTVPIGWGQEMFDQASLIREAVKWDYELRFAEQIGPLLDRAAAIALTPPMGPVYLSLPREVLSELVDAEVGPPAQRPAALAPDPAAIAAAADLIAGAEAPLIVAQRGTGDVDGWAALDRMARDWAVPVSDYWAVSNPVRQDHPAYIGADHGAALAATDVVLAVDALAPWAPDTQPTRPDLKVIQLAPDPLMARAPARHFRADIALATATGPGLAALEAALADKRDAAKARIAARRPGVEAQAAAAQVAARPAPEGPMTKARVGAMIGAAIAGRDATVLSELGVPLAPLGLTGPGQWRQEPHSGGLGWALPAALGMKQADPARMVVATMGDGAFIFANPVACLMAAEALGLAPVVVVLNNAGYGAVRASIEGQYPDGAAARANARPFSDLSPAPDFTAIARASRAWAAVVDKTADFASAFAEAARQAEAGRFALLDVRIVD